MEGSFKSEGEGYAVINIVHGRPTAPEEAHNPKHLHPPKSEAVGPEAESERLRHAARGSGIRAAGATRVLAKPL